MKADDREAYARRARALIRTLTTCVACLENPEANVAHVTKWIDRLDSPSTRDADSRRWTLLINVVRSAWELTADGLTDHGAAVGALAQLATVDPDLAARLTPDIVAPIVAMWRVRKENVGRRGRSTSTSADAAIAKLGRDVGLASLPADSVRKRRHRGVLPP